MVAGYSEIAKDIQALKAHPNIDDYESQRENWNWYSIWAELDIPNGLINQAHECIDRHALGERAEKLAMIWQSASGEIENYTYADMKRETDKVANAFRSSFFVPLFQRVSPFPNCGRSWAALVWLPHSC